MTSQEDLRQENEDLKAALRPFAEAAADFRPDDSDTMRPASVQAVHYRRAAAILGLPYAPFRAPR